MNSTTYHVLCSYAGPRLLRPHPWPVPAVLPFPLHFTTAVYVVVGGDGRCCYVGSVGRRAGGLAERIAEHLSDAAKRATWHTVWVLPLRADTVLPEVRRIEGVVGAHLRPHRSRRLPVPRPPDASAGRSRHDVATVEAGKP